MLRFILTVFFTALVTFCWLVFNPGNSARSFLETAGLLKTLQKAYPAGEIEADPGGPAPSPAPGPSELPAESDLALRPSPAPDEQQLPSSPPAPPPAPAKKAFTPRGIDYDGMIDALIKENDELLQRIELTRTSRSGNIRSSDAESLKRRVSDNLARIKELQHAKKRASEQ